VEAYIVDWLNLLARWLHFITGVAWIGASFYFIWLDNHLEPPRSEQDAGRGVGGEVWSVHGGGFYHAQKYRTAPPFIPETLHWFKWEAYSTWLSGMFLLVLVYWYGAQVYLIDPAVAQLSPLAAVVFAAGIIVVGWVVYDLLCRSPLRNNERLFAAVLFLFVGVLAWGLCALFSGRGAYIHFGAVLGTIMVANVFFVIIPGQKRMVAAAERGAAPNAEDGVRAKQRSVHNTYFTLPVLFVMTSNHYAMTYSHEYNWAILIAISLAGALIRVFFVARHAGKASPLPLVIAGLLLAGVAALIAPRASATSGETVAFEEVHAVVAHRCTTCHSSQPTHPAFPAAPGGVVLDTREQIVAEAQRIHQQTVVTRAMPIGNLTNITEAEREVIDRWYQGMEAGR
jgi:uncharacterized membrane protein